MLNMVTVVCVSYNAEKYIEEAIDSVFKQTFKNFEVIVIDDGSKDSTLTILQKYFKEPNFGLIKRNHVGNPGRLRNEAIKLSKYDLIAFIDADDVWIPLKLEKQLKYMEDYDLVCSNAERIVESNLVFDSLVSSTSKLLFGRKAAADFSRFTYTDLNQDTDIDLKKLLSMNYVITSSVLITRDALIKANYFEDTLGYRGEDFLLWLRVAKDHKIRFMCEPLVKYRIHSANLSMLTYKERCINLERSVDIHTSYLKDRDQSIRKATREGLTFVYSELSKLTIDNKDYRSAAKYWFLYIRYRKGRFSKVYVKYVLIFLYLIVLSLLYGDSHKNKNLIFG